MEKNKKIIELRSNNFVPGMTHVTSGVNLCRLPNGLICIGCCGFDFAKDLTDKTPFLNALQQNTEEYKKYDSKEKFKKRYELDDIHDCGICRHLIITGKKNNHLQITCPLHPCENNGEELRLGECDGRFMCNTQNMFLKEWGPKTKKLFLEFLSEQDLDWFEYSKMMYHNKLSKKFMKTHRVENYLS